MPKQDCFDLEEKKKKKKQKISVLWETAISREIAASQANTAKGEGGRGKRRGKTSLG